MEDEFRVAPVPGAPVRSAAPAGASGRLGEPSRRGFFVKALAALIGGFVSVVPVAAGVLAFLDPLKRKGKGAEMIPVAPLDALPADGVPRQFPVVASRVDAWTLYADQPIGAVYLRRMPGTNRVTAVNASCPHAGCFVNFKPERGEFQCPCHTSAFAIGGERVLPSPSPRDMDSLECRVEEIDGRQQVLVRFENFYTGLKEKKPRA